jgi:hypothetical protein
MKRSSLLGPSASNKENVKCVCQNFFKDEDGAGAAENGEGLAAEQAEDSSGDTVAQK